MIKIRGLTRLHNIHLYIHYILTFILLEVIPETLLDVIPLGAIRETILDVIPETL